VKVLILFLSFFIAKSASSDDFKDAVIANDLQKLQAFNLSAREIESKVIERKSIISIAVRESNAAVLKFLLDSGVNPNGSSNERSTPLYHAVTKNDIKKAAVLLDYGADMHKGHRGLSALINSILMERESIFLMFLKRGADIDVEDYTGSTPLFYTMNNKRLLILSALLEKNANINHINFNGKSLLHFAAFYGNETLVDFIIKNRADIKIIDKKGKSPLHHAAIGGSIEIVDLLLKNGADLHSKDNKGKTPLDYAKEIPHEELVRYFESL
jgi:ankyrin repeat protein